MPTSKRLSTLLVAIGIFGGMMAVAHADDKTCATATVAGGDWSSYGHDYSNTRSQPAEDAITATNAATLAKAWTFSPTDEGGIGRIESTPVVAEGCVYITTSSGFIYALNADTGDLVWKKRLEEPVTDVCCGGTLFAPSIHDGVLYENVSHNPATSTDAKGPYVVALNSQTGDEIWKSAPVAQEPGAYTNSSSVYFDGMVWIGISGPEQEFNNAGGFAILDAATGQVLVRTHTVPQDQFENAGMGGGSIWSTPALDPASKYAYVGAGQPSTWDGPESEYTDAILKFDFNRSRATFGQIVDSYKATPDDAPYVDVDMAASPTLYRDADNQQMVANFQKSGWLHAARTRNMTGAWARPLAPIGTAIGNYASTATDGSNIFVTSTYPGMMYSINGTTGIPNWAVPAPTVLGANPVAYANGLVYLADGKGVLNVWDAATGAQVLARPMSTDVGSDACTNAGGGVSIARHTVFAVCGDERVQADIGPSNGVSGWLIAYKLADATAAIPSV